MPTPTINSIFISLFIALASITASHAAEPDKARKPIFSYIDEDGAVQSLNTGGSKLTAVHFWAVWCVPCVAELPEVDKTKAKYRGKGLRIISISMDTSSDKVKKFFQKHRIKHLPAYLDNQAISFQAARIPGLPATLFFNKKGEEIARADGPMPWKEQQNIDFLESNLK